MNLITVITEQPSRKVILHKTLVQCAECMRIVVLANIVTQDEMKDRYCYWCAKCRECKKTARDGDHLIFYSSGHHEFKPERRSK